MRVLVAGLAQEGSLLYGIGAELLRQIVSLASPHSTPLVYNLCEQAAAEPLCREQSHFRIAVRKRPMLEFERKAGEYDVVDTDGWAQSDFKGRLPGGKK